MFFPRQEISSLYFSFWVRYKSLSHIYSFSSATWVDYGRFLEDVHEHKLTRKGEKKLYLICTENEPYSYLCWNWYLIHNLISENAPQPDGSGCISSVLLSGIRRRRRNEMWERKLINFDKYAFSQECFLLHDSTTLRKIIENPCYQLLCELCIRLIVTKGNMNLHTVNRRQCLQQW